MNNEEWLQRQAWDSLNGAVNRGIIIREPCEVCGEENTHGHHADYTKPLDVKWLCAKHHKEQHLLPFEDYPDLSEQASEEYRAFLDQLRKYCSVRGRKLELARKLKVSPQLVTYWLRGDRQLSLEQFFAIRAIMEDPKK